MHGKKAARQDCILTGINKPASRIVEASENLETSHETANQRSGILDQMRRLTRFWEKIQARDNFAPVSVGRSGSMRRVFDGNPLI